MRWSTFSKKNSHEKGGINMFENFLKGFVTRTVIDLLPHDNVVRSTAWAAVYASKKSKSQSEHKKTRGQSK